jgi:hypothetical protein
MRAGFGQHALDADFGGHVRTAALDLQREPHLRGLVTSVSTVSTWRTVAPGQRTSNDLGRLAATCSNCRENKETRDAP